MDWQKICEVARKVLVVIWLLLRETCEGCFARRGLCERARLFLFLLRFGILAEKSKEPENGFLKNPLDFH